MKVNTGKLYYHFLPPSLALWGDNSAVVGGIEYATGDTNLRADDNPIRSFSYGGWIISGVYLPDEIE